MASTFENRIMESSVSTGVGTFALQAVDGWRRFGSKLAVGATCHYVIASVDAVGRATGEVEWGIGTYSAADRLTRTTVVGSSNTDARVDFAPGTKMVALTALAPTTAALQADWRAAIGLDKVSNLAPPDLPVSTATMNALDLKASKESPSFTGTAKVVGALEVSTTAKVGSTLAVTGDVSTAGNLSIRNGTMTFTSENDTGHILRVNAVSPNVNAALSLNATGAGTPYVLWARDNTKLWQVNAGPQNWTLYNYQSGVAYERVSFTDGMTGLKSGLKLDGYGQESSGNFQSQGIEMNPNWNAITIQGYHVPGNWAGLRFIMPSGVYEFRNGGEARKPGGGSWADTSDERTKHNIADYSVGLAEVLALRPRVFSYREETGRNSEQRFVGLIAQEVETVMPGLVRQESGTLGSLTFPDLRSVDPSNLTYALINAIHALHARIAALEGRP